MDREHEWIYLQQSLFLLLSIFALFLLFIFLLLILGLLLLSFEPCLFDQNLLHSFQFLKAKIDFLQHLIPLIFFMLELSRQCAVLLLYLSHTSLVLVGYLHDLVDGDSFFRLAIFVVDADHTSDFLFEFLGLLLVGLRELCGLLADLSELFEMFGSYLFLFVVALHSNYIYCTRKRPISQPLFLQLFSFSNRPSHPHLFFHTISFPYLLWFVFEFTPDGIINNWHMLAIEKSKDLIQQINRIIRRMEHIKQVKTQQFQFLRELQELYSSFSQRIHKEMIVFEENIIKNSLYSTEKTNYIINLAKIYREFSVQLEKTSKINLINLTRIRTDDSLAQEQKLQRKCDLFLKEFQTYLAAEKNYNSNYNTYSDKCALLDQTIRRYRSYQDPIAFYNQTLTNEYISELDKHYNDCSNFQTTVVNDTQGLDQTRKWMGDHIKEINQYYVILLHIYLRTVEDTITCIVQPKKDDQFQKGKLGLRSSELQSTNQQNTQLQKLNNLYASSQVNNQHHIQDNIIQQYSQLFKKTFAQSQLNSDYKFFYDRCDSIRGKKLKTTQEVFRIQTLLIVELGKQCESYASFEKEYRAIERDVFTNNGIDSFKKRFRKYFGSNFMEVQQLCFAIMERQKRSMEKIGKSMDDSREKLSKLIENKQESIKFFEKRTKAILDDHLKLKERTYCRNSVDTQQLKCFKESIAQSFNEFKKSFVELQKSESEIDRLFFSTLKSHCEIILKEAIGKNLSRTLQKEKIRVNILRSLNVDSEIILILKQDSRYEMLMNQCPKPDLYANFQSLAKKKEYDETKRLLQMKENRLKGMIRSKQGCCGITSEPIKDNVLSQHKCKLRANGQKAKGVLNITSSGLIFEQATWLPFSDGLRLLVPQSDINAFDTKTQGEKESVEVSTDFGNLVFQSKVCKEIIESMQKNITFKPIREGSEKGRRNDSSSFLKNNTSTEFKLSYDKNNGSSSDAALKQAPNKPNSKPKTSDIIKDFVSKWKQGNFLSEHFTRIIKNLPEKSESRRDYQYSNGHNKFVLKERREAAMEGKDVALTYEWKVCFPDTPMLHSFKHNEKVHVQGLNKDLRVRIVMGKLTEEQLFIRNKFYRQIEEMNDRLTKFIVNTLQKEADVLIEPEDDGQKSVDSCDIIIQPYTEQKFQKGDNTLRTSRVDRQKSTNLSSNGFKTQ